MLLHAVLIGGSAVFALPYAWLLGTSWKLDKEVQTAALRILPSRPIPAPASPYVDVRGLPPPGRPAQVPAGRWGGWMSDLVASRIEALLDAWQDPRAAGLDADGLRRGLRAGVFDRLLSLVPYDAWRDADRPAFERRLDRVLTPQLVDESFARIYRFLAFGPLRLVTQDYRVRNLGGAGGGEADWAVNKGSVRLERRLDAGREVLAACCDYTQGPMIELAADFTVEDVDLADPATGFRRLELSFRSDESWHDLRMLVEFGGRLYRSRAPQYLGNDRWWEVRFQLPGEEDRQLMPRRYILLESVAEDRAFDHGPHRLRCRLQVHRSGVLRALWAKGTENYRTAFNEVPFWRYFKTSAFLVVANVLGTLLSCSLAAYAFARLQWPGRDLCFMLVLATLMIPPQVTMIPSFVIYRHLGWYNTLAPLWVPSCLAVNGFGIFLLRQAMKGIPRDLEEAARIDGCGCWRIYWHIMLPLVRPTLAAIAIFTFLSVWNDFMTPLIYVNDQRLYPLSLGLFSFMAGRENQFTLIMAGSAIMTIPVILIFFFAQRYFIQGVTMTGMKG